LIKANDEIYNEYVDSGDFFQIPAGESKITLVKLDKDREPVSDSSEWATISYNYYYF
jgi:hypothetical protein